MSDASEVLLGRLRGGEAHALGELFDQYRDRLWRMLFFRLDRRLGGRVAPEDVLQEAYLDVSRRIQEYLDAPAVPFYVWIRFLTVQKLLAVQRAHLGVRARDASQEVPLADCDSMAGQFVGHMTSPSQAAMRRELQERLRSALDEMDPLDREVLALRHFEELGNAEAAAVLGISKDAASKRHVRALRRLRDILSEGPEAFSNRD